MILKKRKMIALVSLVLAGCNTPHTEQVLKSEKLPALNVVAIDRSGSTLNMRETQILALKSAFARAADWGEEVAIYMVDRETTCVYSAKKVSDDSRIPKDVLKKLKTTEGVRSNRTRPYLFWKEMDKKRLDKNRRMRILYLTDGDNDWKEEDRLIDKMVRNLSLNKNINVALLGLNEDAELRIKSQFSCFEGRVSYFVGKDKAAISAGISKWRRTK